MKVRLGKAPNPVIVTSQHSPLLKKYGKQGEKLVRPISCSLFPVNRSSLILNSSSMAMNKVGMSYLLWAACFVSPFHGLHRFYNGKIGTGLLWFCTFGLFGVGQFVDLFLIPRMVDEHNAKVRSKLGVSAQGVPLYSPQNQVTLTLNNSQEQLRIKLLKAAAARGGKLSVTQGVMATGLSFDEVEKALKTMLKSGYVGIDNDPKTGVIVYDFHEL